MNILYSIELTLIMLARIYAGQLAKLFGMRDY